MSWGSEQRQLTQRSAPQWNTPAITAIPPSQWHPQEHPVFTMVADIDVAVELDATPHVDLAAVVDAASDIAAVPLFDAIAILAGAITIPAGPKFDMDAEIDIVAPMDAAVRTDDGLPYTIPFTIGGNSVAAAVFNMIATIDATSSVDDVTINFEMQADIAVEAGMTLGSGLPYEIPFTLLGDAPEPNTTVPYELPFEL